MGSGRCPDSGKAGRKDGTEERATRREGEKRESDNGRLRFPRNASVMRATCKIVILGAGMKGREINKWTCPNFDGYAA